MSLSATLNAPRKDTYVLPDTLSRWPWLRRFNPSYEETKIESSRWICGFDAFSPKAQNAFERCDFTQLRVACDMLQLFFVFDEYSDPEPEVAVRKMATAIMNGMTCSNVSDGHVLNEISRQFWERATTVCDPKTQDRFIESFRAYTDAVVQQARDRDCATVRDVTEYFIVRRHTIGTIPCFVLLQLDMHLPDSVTNHPYIVELETLATDMIILCNDLYSYNVEQARGDDTHNILTIVQLQYNLDLDKALLWLDEYHGRLVTAFLDAKRTLPSFGPTYDTEMSKYVDGLGNWVRANESWSFESHRYFGSHGLEIQRQRRVHLLPKMRPL
ncbi:terpenoid synthase [Exidia glandulosa HHB12029]|uniref:Terpene synthase n=1 Tax=Exidia glandulosa HHB12029 TaxID=1314781 RepID=A0A165DYV6_EXIGL|nr:terpenoid synthase [Exidia glandulosa HHB12029]